MTDERAYRDSRHPATCLCVECKESYRIAQIEEMRRRDAERDRRETERRRERERRQRSRLLLKVGAVVSIALIFFGALGVWALLSTPQQDSTVSEPDANDELSLLASDGGVSMIAFASNRDGDFEIYTMLSDGSDVRRLTDNQFNDHDPSWSPGGYRIVFMSDRYDRDSEIYTMSSGGSGVIRLTYYVSSIVSGNRFPSWSPNGSQIAFSSYYVDDDPEIRITLSNGSTVNLCRIDSTDEFRPSWSPNGFRIAFSSGRDGDYQIYTMSSNCSDVRRLTDSRGNHMEPSWSPDGSRIAFSSDRDGDYQIYTMSSNGSDVRRLTKSGGRSPSWSPDGSHIVFTSDRDGDFEIYTMSSDGADVKQLTHNQSDDSDPSWSPSLPPWSPLLPLVDNFGGEFIGGRTVVGGISAGEPMPGVGWAIRTESGESEIALAEHLANQGKNFRIFCEWWSPDCHTQKELFGAEAWAIVKSRYVECSPNNRQGVTPECKAFARVGQIPTWFVVSYLSTISGALNLDDLALITGYAGPTDFRFIQG